RPPQGFANLILHLLTPKRLADARLNLFQLHHPIPITTSIRYIDGRLGNLSRLHRPRRLLYLLNRILPFFHPSLVAADDSVGSLQIGIIVEFGGQFAKILARLRTLNDRLPLLECRIASAGGLCADPDDAEFRRRLLLKLPLILIIILPHVFGGHLNEREDL